MTPDLDELQAVLDQATPPIRVPSARAAQMTPLGRALICELTNNFAWEGPTTFMVKLFDEPILPPVDASELAAASRPDSDAAVTEPASTGEAEADSHEIIPMRPLPGPIGAEPCRN